jgi:hypothetical protein
MSLRKLFTIFVYVNLFSLLLFSAAYACDRYDYRHDRCNCYVVVKAPKCDLDIVKDEQSMDARITIHNNTNHRLSVKFSKGGDVRHSFTVAPLCDETVCVAPAKYSYSVESYDYCEVFKKGSQTFKKGNDYSWSITVKDQKYIYKTDYVPCRKEVYRTYPTRVVDCGRSYYVPPCEASCFNKQRICGLRDSEVVISNDTDYRIYYNIGNGASGCVAPCSQEIVNVIPGRYRFHAKTLCGSIVPVTTLEDFCDGYRHHMRVFVKK